MATITDYSRFLFCQGLTDTGGNLYLTDRVPFAFASREDSRNHTVTEGDTLFGLANLYYRQLPRPAQFFWAIADFNGIMDATLKLQPGTVLVIPSVRMLVEEILNESRRAAFTG